eukprot:Lankesteria_metandrocarpae@DN4998_c0_g1_i1.p1
MSSDAFNVVVAIGDVQHLVWPAPLAGAAKATKSALPNPRVEVVVLGNSQVSQTYQSTASCAFRKTFHFPSVFPDDPSLAQIEIRVHHVKAYFFQDLIGVWTCTFESVYNRKDHRIVKTWLPITTPQRPSETRGFVQVSIWVLRPNDQLVPETAGDLALSLATTLDSGNFDFEKYELSLNIFSGLDLLHPDLLSSPPVDVQPVNPDVAVSATFLGVNLETSVQQNTRTPVWNESLKIPARVPCIEDNIRLELLDYSEDPPAVLGIDNLSFSKVVKAKMKPTWINFYRHSTALTKKGGAFSLFGGDDGSAASQGGIECVGRVLVSVDCQKHQQPIPQVTTCMATGPPPVAEYVLWADIYEVSGLRESPAIRVQLSLGTWRCAVTPSFQVSGNHGFDDASGHLQPQSFVLPDSDMCQDLILRLYTWEENMAEQWHCAASCRLPVADLLQANDRPKWFKASTAEELGERLTVSSNRYKPEESLESTAVQLLGSFCLKSVAEVMRYRQNRPPRHMYQLRQWLCRANIFQAVNLPLVSNQMPDSFAIIQMGGCTVVSETMTDTLNPEWNEILVFESALPSDLTLAQNMVVGVVHGGSLLGAVSLPPVFVSRMNRKCPEWFDLKSVQFPDSQARLLCSFDLQPATADPRSTHLDAFSPEYTACNIQIALLGARFFPGTKRTLSPFIQLEYGRNVESPHEPLWVRQAVPVQGGYGMFNYLKRFQLKCHLPESHIYQSFVECRVCDREPGGEPFEIGVGYLHLNPFIPWVDAATRKQLKKEFRQTSEATMDLFKPVTRKFRSQFYDLDDTTGAASRHDGTGPVKMVTGARYELDSLEEDEPNLGSEDDFLISTPRLRLNQCSSSDQNEPLTANVQSSPPDSYVAVTPEKITDVIKRKVFRLKGADRFEWMKPDKEEEEALVHSIAEEELKSTLEHELDLDDLPYIHVMIIDPDQQHSNSATGGVNFIGYLKVAVKICKPSDAGSGMDPQLDILEHHMSNPVHYKARMHVIAAAGLVPHRTLSALEFAGITSSATADEPSWSLVLENGPADGVGVHQIDDSHNVFTGYSPDIYRSYELDVVLPVNCMPELTIFNMTGSSGLFSLTGMDERQPFVRSIIDIEDRIYHPRFAAITNNGLNVPIEIRPTHQMGTSQGLGSLKCKLELLSAQEAINRPLQPLVLPRTEFVQLRMVIWRIRGVKSESTSSMYVRGVVTMEDGQTEIQESDTHWNSPDGNGVFHWRFVFDMGVPCHSPGLYLQVWNRNLISAHDVIAECFMDFGTDLTKAAKTRSRRKLPRGWYKLTHPSSPEEVAGAIEAEIEIVPKGDADSSPVGLGREEPNREPFLSDVTESRSFLKASPFGGGWFALQSKVKTVTNCCFIMVALFVCMSLISLIRWFIPF